MNVRPAAAVAAALSVALAPGAGRSSTRTVDVGEGISFDLPPGLVENPDVSPPVLRAWNGAADAVFVLVAAVQARSGTEDMLRELQDWPRAGRNMGAGFGDALSGGLSRQLGTPCSYTATPVARDLGRSLAKVKVEVTCETSPEATTFRVLVLLVVTRTSQVAIQVNAAKGSYPVGEDIASAVWSSLTVDPEHRVAAAAADSTPEPPRKERKDEK